MASKNVQYEGLHEVIDAFRSADGIFEREANSFLRDMGIEGVHMAQVEILNVGAVDLMELLDGMHYVIDHVADGMQVTVRPSDTADEYAWFVEHGTKPHKAPIEALRPWAERHGIPVGAVWHKIATEGTEPRYMFETMFGHFSGHVEKEAPRFVDSILRRL